jgi:hypothetical protein
MHRDVGRREDFPSDEELRLARQTTTNTNSKMKPKMQTTTPRNGVNSRVPGRPEKKLENVNYYGFDFCCTYLF